MPKKSFEIEDFMTCSCPIKGDECRCEDTDEREFRISEKDLQACMKKNTPNKQFECVIEEGKPIEAP